jgi:hypothetical protein
MKPVKVLLALFTFILTLCYADSISMDTLHVKSGKELLIPEGVTALTANNLILDANSKILIRGVSKFELVAKNTSIGENCQINANGNSPGANGINLDLNFGSANIGRFLTINTSGAKGATGTIGGSGRPGQDATCVEGCRNGDRGDVGKPGGKGGNGGNINITLSEQSPHPNILAKTNGGDGGNGGTGGAGGRGGDGINCGLYSRGSCYNGHQGPTGKIGTPGNEGTFILQYSN